MASHTPEHTEISSSSCRSTGREKDQWVIVYDPHEHDLFTERVENLKHFNNFEVHLPRWRYRVDIYADGEKKFDFLASIHLGQLGFSKNLKRWRRSNYTSLYVKGSKSWMPEKESASCE